MRTSKAPEQNSRDLCLPVRTSPLSRIAVQPLQFADPTEVLRVSNRNRMHAPRALLRSGVPTTRRPSLRYGHILLGKAVGFGFSKELIFDAVRRYKPNPPAHSTYKCTRAQIRRSRLHADTFSSNTLIDG